MFTLAELDALDVDALPLPARIEASASVRVYLETYAAHTIDPPAWLTNLHHTLRGEPPRGQQRTRDCGRAGSATTGMESVASV